VVAIMMIVAMMMMAFTSSLRLRIRAYNYPILFSWSSGAHARGSAVCRTASTANAETMEEATE